MDIVINFSLRSDKDRAAVPVADIRIREPLMKDEDDVREEILGKLPEILEQVYAELLR